MIVESETDPIWDLDKEALLGKEPDAFNLKRVEANAPVAGRWWRATIAGETVGFASLLAEEQSDQQSVGSHGCPHTVELIVGIREDRRGSGIGQQILEVVLEVARVEGCDAVTAVVSATNPRAKDVLTWLFRNGFAPLAGIPKKDAIRLLDRQEQVGVEILL